jgi:hypothetical protein
MLFQMTFEKLGKPALLRSSAVSLELAKTTHTAASHMLLVMQPNVDCLLRWVVRRFGKMSCGPCQSRAIASSAAQGGPQLE